MKHLKRFFFVSIAFLSILLIAALFAKKDYAVKRSIHLPTTSDVVYNYLKFLRNQQHVAKWFTLDKNIKLSIKGEDGNVGAQLLWEGNDTVGSGFQELKMLQPNSTVVTTYYFNQSKNSELKSTFLIEDDHNNTSRLTWTMEGHAPYPFNALMMFVDIDERMGGDLDYGLNQLKEKIKAN